MIVMTEVYTCSQTGLQVPVHITKHVRKFKRTGSDKTQTVTTRYEFQTVCGQHCTAATEDLNELLVYTGRNELIRITK